MRLLDGHTVKAMAGPDEDGPGWRSVAAAEVVVAVEPFFGEVGITRVANVTGLDRVGVPVWQAIRPNSRGLAVSQGKGVTHELARASAVMESIESWHAERCELPVRVESIAGLAPTGRVIDPTSLARDANGTYSPFAPVPFCLATDVRTDVAWWVPFELVHTNMVVPLVAGSGMFARGTNGLASGATLAEAVLHGLCEVIERDAFALWAARAWIDESETRIDPAAVTEPTASGLIEQVRDAGLDPLLWDLTSDTGVPCVSAVLWDPQADADLNPAAASAGYGCHPDPRIAMTRALTEAAQSRLTLISGARDDLTRARYLSTRTTEAYGYWNRVRQLDEPRRWEHPVPETETVEDDLRGLLDALRAVGLPQVLVLDLSRVGWPVHVARVIVPGAEAPHEAAAYVAGRRAAAAAQGSRA